MDARLSILSPLAPYPPHAGGTAHTVGATRQLARFYEVALYALAAEPAAVGWGPLAEWCRELRAFPQGRARPVGLRPPGVELARSPELVRALESEWARHPPDVVQLEFTSMAQYAPLACRAGALVVCTAHNVAFLAQARRARREPTPRVRARRWIGALSLWAYELRALRDCHLVVTLGEADAEALRRWLPRLPIVFVPSGIELGEWSTVDPAAGAVVLFVGNYAHPPNVEGALWLGREVWPLVRRAHGAARLVLAGRAPPPAVRAMAAPDVAVPGTVDDLRPLYAGAGVAAAPVFWGSGVRIKILEALASRLPLVTTALAAEGIGLEDGRSALFAETPESFASAIVRLLDDRALRARLGAAGRALVEERYDWERIGRRLAGLYEGARAGKRRWTTDDRRPTM